MQNPSTRLLNAAAGYRGLRFGVIAFLILMALQKFGALPAAENYFQDVLRRRLAEPLDPRIELVYLDDVSLRQMEDQFQYSYPWPRELHANTVDVLRQAGAKAIIYDFLFTSTSNYGEDDKAFAKAMKDHGRVVIGMQFTAIDQPEGRKEFLALPPLHQLPEAGPLWDIARGVDHPREPLWSAAFAVGDTNFFQDNDSIGRKTRLALTMEDRGYPSLSYAGALAAGLKPAIPPLGKAELLFRKPPDEAHVSRLFDVTVSKQNLEDGTPPLVDLARFKDKIVLIGSSAPGLKDLRPTPMSREKDLPGVFLQAVALDNLLTGQFLQAWHAPKGVRPLILFLLCVGVAMLSFRLRGFFIVVPALALIAGIIGGSVWAYQAKHLLLPLTHWSAAVLAGLAFGGLEYYFEERKDRQKVQAAFGQFLSPAVLASLKSKGGQLEMGGETRTLTVFFSDLQGFTNFSEKLSPHDLVLILNEYLDEMVDVVVGQHDATVDKYIGDAIMAFWNAPADQPDHALRGCQAAWHCQVKLAQIQDALKAKGLDAGEEGLVMRIGLNTGPAVAGLMGSQRKLNYTVMGDTVNTASRLEGANKPYGSRIMIAQATKDAAGPTVITRPLDYIKVKGKAEATAVYEVIGLEGEPGRLYPASYVERWSASLEAYKTGDFQGALSGFQGCQRLEPKDKACALFIDRCEHYLAEPPSNWDGVYTMKTK